MCDARGPGAGAPEGSADQWRLACVGGHGPRRARVLVNAIRLWLAVAHATGHKLKTFGNVKLSEGGPLNLA